MWQIVLKKRLKISFQLGENAEFEPLGPERAAPALCAGSDAQHRHRVPLVISTPGARRGRGIGPGRHDFRISKPTPTG